MSRNILDDHRIQEILEEDGIEGEVSSEIEDNLEIDDDDSNSSQSGDDDNSEAEDFSAGNISAEMLHRRPDLSDVPLSYIRQGYYVGRNGSTNWSIEEPPRNVRTRSHNIIFHAPGLINEAKDALTPLDCCSFMFSDSLLDTVVTYTNMYIDSIHDNFQRKRDCLHTDLSELKALLGLHYYCGKLRGAHLNTMDFWAIVGTGSDVCIATMSRQRFNFLLRCLRFDDPNIREQRRQNDKLAAIRDLFTKFV
ncbi:unnamed protein product [Parnassius apollo]|uniref:(apollo) hypothetical protein n=1 Tax=Parnassius apollo TaxID=110799 RepID=A0A8S3W309_PARAO|nr:unnamed protein product [Parnassius apollo]